MAPFDFTASDFKERAKTVLPHIATDTAIPVLNNARMFADSAGQVWLEATDRFTAIRVQLEHADPWEGELDALIPRAVLADVVKTIKTRDHVVALEQTDRGLLFTVNYGATFVAPATTPDFQSHVNKFPNLTPILERSSVPTVTPDVVAFAPEHLEKYGKRHMPKGAGIVFELGETNKTVTVRLNDADWMRSAIMPRRLLGPAFYADRDTDTNAA